jgi:hypothetical protein
LIEEETEDDQAMVTALATLIKENAPPRLTGYVERIVPGYTENEFRENFRMPRIAFEKLLHIIGLRLEDTRTKKYFSIEKDLLATIWILANQDTYR